MLNINKVIVLENGEEYLVLDKVNYQDTDYYYIAKVNESETDIENDYKLCWWLLPKRIIIKLLLK